MDKFCKNCSKRQDKFCAEKKQFVPRKQTCGKFIPKKK